MISLCLSFLAAAALTMAAGAGLVALFAPARLYLPEWIALSWLFGSMSVSLGLWLCSFLFHGLALQCAITLLCLSLGTIAFLRRKSHRSIRLTTWDRVLWTLLFVQFVAVFYCSFKHTLGWDGLLNWEFKAHMAYESGGRLPSAYFADHERAFSHPEYPLGIPNLELWFYLWLGEANQFWIKAIFPLFYVAGTLLLVSLIERFSQRRILALISGLLFFFVPQFLVNPGAAVTGYADFPLAIFYLGAIGFLILGDQDQEWFRLAVFFLTFLPWLKREGIVLWSAGTICAFLFRRGRSLGKTIFGVSGGLLVFLCWETYLLANHFAASDFGAVKLENSNRLLPTLLALVRDLFDVQSWSLLWYGAIAGLLILFRQSNFQRGLVLLLAIAIPLSFDVFVYLFSAWPDYLRHVDLSLSRLVMQVAPVAFLLTSCAAAIVVPDPAKTRTAGVGSDPSGSLSRGEEPAV